MARIRTVATDIDPDQAPAAGGSYVRQPDTGELKRVGGTDMDVASQGADAASAPAETPAATANNQE